MDLGINLGTGSDTGLDTGLDALAAVVDARLAALGASNGLADLGGGLHAFAQRRAAPPEERIYEPVLALVLRGRKAVRVGDRPVEWRRGQSLLIGVDLAVTTRVTEAPYLSLSLRPDLDLLRDLAAGLPPAPPGAGEAWGAAAADGRLTAAMARLLDLLAAPRALAALGPLALREAHFWMLEGPHGPALRGLLRADGAANRIARAAAAIREDPSRPLRVEALARAVGMSASAFHAHFRRLTATTPVQFQKRLRLADAQARLRAGAGVGEAAFAVGYESPTQFSRDYRRAFGLAPREERGALAAE